MKIVNGKHGASIAEIPQFQSCLRVHPNHVGFVIGGKGATVKKIASDCKCYIKIQDPNSFSGGFPWFIIKGSTIANVDEAYHRLITIANEAERRMPCLNTTTPPNDRPVPRPRAKLNILSKTPPPESEQMEVTVVEKHDNEGNIVLVDEATNEVYDASGRLVGHFLNGTLLGRSDESV